MWGCNLQVVEPHEMFSSTVRHFSYFRGKNQYTTLMLCKSVTKFETKQWFWIRLLIPSVWSPAACFAYFPLDFWAGGLREYIALLSNAFSRCTNAPTFNEASLVFWLPSIGSNVFKICLRFYHSLHIKFRIMKLIVFFSQ